MKQAEIPGGPRVGDIGVAHVGGRLGKLIAVLQWLYGDGWSEWRHVVICVKVSRDGQSGLCVQAQPGGANLQWFGPDHGILWSRLDLTRAQRKRIARISLKYLGAGYSFADYFAMLLHRLRLPLPWLKTYIASSRHMICSQLADQIYRDSGIQLFTDGRWPGYVSPAGLAHRLFVTPVMECMSCREEGEDMSIEEARKRVREIMRGQGRS